LPFQLRQSDGLLVVLLGESVEALLRPRRRTAVVRELVLVAVALGLEGRFRELVLLVSEVDLRVEVLQLGLELPK